MSALSKPIAVTELSESGLIRERWIFSVQGQLLILDRYHYERRWSVGQEFKVVKFYDRNRVAGEDYGDWQWLTEAEVPWDDDLQGQAISELMARFQVVRQSDLDPAPEPEAVVEPT